MTVIEVRDVVRGTDPASKVKLTATVILGGVLIRGVRLVESRRGAFVSLPSRRVDEKWVDVVELSESLTSRVRLALLAALAPPVAGEEAAWPPPPPDDRDPPSMLREVMP
jgi:DNA-binding cell septation regulator SpoVG